MENSELTRFIPMSRAEMDARGWRELDVLFVSGDAYVDHPAFGIPLLARVLEAKGYRVGIIAQPDWKKPESLHTMGQPRLCVCVGAGAMDSMVNRYTAAKKVRNEDAYSPGGVGGRRPDRATIAYTAAAKGAFKGVPVIIGGIEASLRRLAHYDYWDNKVRRSVLADSKADLLVYGMSEQALTQAVHHLAGGGDLSTLTELPGIARWAKTPPPQAIILPSFAAVKNDAHAYNEAFRLTHEQQTPTLAAPVAQGQGSRFVVVHPPAAPLTTDQMDQIYALPFTREPHPSYTEKIPAFEQIRWSVTTHRGCYGGCSFCAIAAHQGRQIVSRSADSVCEEISTMAQSPAFGGTITDLGGPTANMYGTHCGNPKARRSCRRTSCLWPSICRHLRTSDKAATHLLRRVRKLPKVRHAFVASGLRTDLFERQETYFKELMAHHTGGLLKVAPETTVESVAQVMHKPGPASFLAFLRWFWRQNKRLGRQQGVVPYLIAGHPGCTLNDMVEVALFLKSHRLQVEQVQEFTPTPGSLASCLYYTGIDPFSGEKVYVPRNPRERRLQKALLLYHQPQMRSAVETACRKAGREDALPRLLDRSAKRRTAGRSSTQKPRRTRRR